MRRILSLLVLAVALTSVTGHLMGVAVMYHWGTTGTAGMGINTAICLCMMAIWQLTGKE